MHFFDAGKADAILLTTADSAVLIDTGEKGFETSILTHLEDAGIKKLDYLIITHFDKDHVGGAAKIINSIPIGTVLQNSRSKDSKEYENKGGLRVFWKDGVISFQVTLREGR